MDFDHFLIDKGMHVCPGWPQQWQEAAQSAVPGFAQKSVSSKQELLYQEVLHSNLHFIGKQALPEDLQVWVWVQHFHTAQFKKCSSPVKYL